LIETKAVSVLRKRVAEQVAFWDDEDTISTLPVIDELHIPSLFVKARKVFTSGFLRDELFCMAANKGCSHLPPSSIHLFRESGPPKSY
jgi:cytochrome c-type biogenesis protein CcmE